MNYYSLMFNVIRYTESDFNKVSECFNAELDENIINTLLEIKKNNKFIKRRSPLRLKYKTTELWRLSQDTDNKLSDEEIVSKLVTSNLNKLSDKNFQLIYDDIVKIIEAYPDVNLTNTIDIIFEKSIEENFYSEVYSNLYYNLLNDNVDMIKYLSDKCNIFYDKFTSLNFDENIDDDDYDNLCRITEKKSNILGGFMMISNLYMKNLLPYQIIERYYLDIIANIPNVSTNTLGIYIECLVSILRIVGEDIEKKYSTEFNEIFMKNIRDLINHKHMIPKYKFKILDFLDLHSNNWISDSPK